MFDDIVVPTAANKGKPKSVKSKKERLPVPQGRLVVKRLSPREAEKIKRLGLDSVSSQDILPENFEDIAISALEQVTKQRIPNVIAGLEDTEDELMRELEERVAKNKPRVKDVTIDIESLSDAQQKAYLSLVSDSLEQYKQQLAQEDELANLPPNLAQSVRDADIEVDLGEETEEAPESDPVAADIEGTKPTAIKQQAPKQATQESADDKHVGEFCARCGFPKADKFDIMQVSKDEEERYLAAAATLSDYEQVRSALNDKIKLTFRVLSVDDEDIVWQAMTSLPTTDNNRAIEMLQRYRLVLQLKTIKLANGRVITLPGAYRHWQHMLNAKGVDDTSLETCWQVFKSNLNMTESLRRVLFREMFLFNGIVQRLETLSAQENLRNF